MASAPTFTGAEAMIANLERIGRKADNEAGKALFEMGQIIMGRSKRDFVPQSPPRTRKKGEKGKNRAGTGNPLKSSGNVQRPKRSGFGGKDIEVTLEYGGPAAPYALAIHDHPSGASPPSWEGKTLNFYLGGEHGTKYLERPLLEAAPTLARKLGVLIDLDGS